jgi:formylglycine-generating enzyme required for sulfatase activity
VRKTSAAALVTATALFATNACSLFVSLDGLTGDSTTSDAAAPSDATTGDSGDASVVVDGGSDGACPSAHGPAMVMISDSTPPFCIDSTEITNANYRDFLQANVPLTGQPSPRCDGNTSFIPQNGSGTQEWPLASSADSFPVAFVDWCDAFAYCNWAGKRLCGEIGGGASAVENHGDANHSQWYHACSKNGSLVYPYGSAYEPLACNGRDLSDGGASLAVASLSTCVGGYPGIFDIAGNVEEWTDSCDDAGCLSRGGSFVDFGPNTVEMCADATQDDPPLGRSGDIGFRCCAF